MKKTVFLTLLFTLCFVTTLFAQDPFGGSRSNSGNSSSGGTRIMADGIIPVKVKTKNYPNVIIVLADDLAHSDLSCHGNKNIHTAAFDRLYNESVRLTNFHTDMIGTPTRAAILTGYYPPRVGVWHSRAGRSLVKPQFVMAPKLFERDGYKTALIGKWGLGENYPFRPTDRGFDYVLTHGGNFIGDVGDWWANTMFNPVFSENGVPKKFTGFATDIQFSKAIEWIEKNRSNRFFLMLTPNAPRKPYMAPKKFVDYYKRIPGFTGELAMLYGMVSNLDQNLGKLLNKLDALGLAKNTILVVTTDNGVHTSIRQDEFRGEKGSPYEVGHRVPCFIRFPREMEHSIDVKPILCHFDILPTLLSACEVRRVPGMDLDGRNFVSLMTGQITRRNPRKVVIQSTQFGRPAKGYNSVVLAELVDTHRAAITRTRELRLVNYKSLYCLDTDPEQVSNIASRAPGTLKELQLFYDDWWENIQEEVNKPARIILGNRAENPTKLSCRDWHGLPPASQKEIYDRVPKSGSWEVLFERSGSYKFTVRDRPYSPTKVPLGATSISLSITANGRKVPRFVSVPNGATSATIISDAAQGEATLKVEVAMAGGRSHGAYYLDVEYLGPPGTATETMPEHRTPDVPKTNGPDAYGSGGRRGAGATTPPSSSKRGAY